MGFMVVADCISAIQTFNFYKKKTRRFFPLFIIFMNVYCCTVLFYDANLQSLLNGIPHHPLAFGI